MLCQEETEQAPVVRVQAQEEVWEVEVEEDEDKWEETKQEQVRVGIVCVRNAEQRSNIPGVPPALI
jgi:hypothetical protein